MQTHPRRAHSHQPQGFNYSLDWRFLLPIDDPEKILVGFQEDADFSETLEQVGIPLSNHLALSDIQEKVSAGSFVLPLGLPVGWVDAQRASQIEFLRTIRSLIAPNGYLLVGFNNSLNFYSSTSSSYLSSTPRHMMNQLQKAGFESIKFFGAIPNLKIPEYTFDLGSQAMLFALRHRFKRKPIMLTLLQMIVRTIGLAPISNFLPCYYAVATV